MKRKLLSVLLTFCLAFSLLPTAALADEGEASGNVAKIGEQGYATLAEAIAAANDGQTVKMLNNTKVTQEIYFSGKTITLDLNGKIITGQFEDYYSVIEAQGTAATLIVEDTSAGKTGTIHSNHYGLTARDDGNITVNSGTIIGDDSAALSGNNTTGNMNFTVNGGTLTAGKGPAIYQSGQCNLTITGGTLNGGISLRMGQVNISGGTINATASSIDSPAEYYDYSGNAWLPDALYVFGGTYDKGDKTYGNSLNLNITGGTFNCTNGQGSAVAIYDLGKVTQTANINISGGKFATTTNGRNAYDVLSLKDIGVTNPKTGFGEHSGAVSSAISGGTFSSDVSAYVAEGYVQNENGTVEQLGETNAVAKVGNTYYKTLADAVAAAQDGDTITLLKDAELTSTLNLAKNITIDGQGKYTIKAANSFTVGSDNKTYCVLYVSGEVTLKDVTVNGNEKCRVIFCDKGKLTIDGATITNGKAPNFIGGVYMTSSASFEMKSGSITGNKNAKGYQNDEYLQYSSDLWIGANANGALTAINGGTIGNVFVNANAWSASNPGSFTMNGGTVTNLYVEHDANYGATFKYNDGTIEHLYLSKENGNGQSIEVTPVKGVIYNGGVKEQDLVTLTMKYNDGATADSTYNVASGTTITLPTPRRSGYTFNGWYDGSKFYAAGASYTVSATVTLNASWSYISSGSSYDPTYSVSTPSKTEHGTVTVSPKSASKGDTVTVTVKPDSGYVLETLTVTDKNGNELTLKDKGNGKYTFTMPAGKVEVKATFMEDNSMLNFFYDVPNNAYFYEAVKWAVKNGITDGVGNNLFAPEQPCTRAQIVTFLWRAAGSPEPKGAASGMTDVVSGSYYEKAVAWAIENGITTGTTTSTFSPDATCTRAQAVTFLARALKAKAASAAEFSDVPTGSYFADAVAWAAANGVTEGIGGGLFGSDNDCTRGQIVTFLYRAYNK